MNALDSELKFDIMQLLQWKMQVYDHNNEIKISDSNNNEFAALSFACLNGYITGKE